MKNKQILFTILFLVLLNSLLAVSALDEIRGYNLGQKRTYQSINFYPSENFEYYSNNPNEIIQVTIVTFFDDINKTSLDDWMRLKTAESTGKLNVSNTSVFMYNYNKHVFWRSDKTYVRVSETHPKYTTKDYDWFSVEGKNNFDLNFIEKVLNEYPNSCNTNNCKVEKIIPLDELYPFKTIDSFYWEVNHHIDASFFCPKNITLDGIDEKVTSIKYANERVKDGEKESILQQCSNKGLFYLEGAELNGEIKECYDYLTHILEGIGLGGYDRFLIGECYIRKDFKERYNPTLVSDFNTTYLGQKMQERDIFFIDFIAHYEENADKARTKAIQSGNIPQFEDNMISNEPLDPSKSEIANVVEEQIDVPTPSLLESIKAKIKKIFDWF